MKAILLAAFALISTFALAQGDAMIEINGEKISRDEYVRRMEYLPGIGKVTRGGEFIEVYPSLATIDQLINDRLLLQIAKERGMLPTEADLTAEIALINRRQPELAAKWQASGRTNAEYRSIILIDMTKFRLQTEGILVTDTEIKNLYDLSKDVRFTTVPRVRLRVISVTAEADTKAVDAELKAGKSFAAVAALKSMDASSKTGGLFGEVPLDQLSSNVKEAIAKLKKGDMTEWLKSSDTLWVKFYVDEVLPRTVRPLDADLKEDLKRELMIRKGQQKNDLGKLMREAKQKAKIKIASPELEKAYQNMAGDGKG